MKRFFALIIAFMFIFVPAFTASAAGGCFAGAYIYLNGRPYEDLSVWLYKDGKEAYELVYDENGCYCNTSVAEGVYELYANGEPYNIELTVSKDGENTVERFWASVNFNVTEAGSSEGSFVTAYMDSAELSNGTWINIDDAKSVKFVLTANNAAHYNAVWTGFGINETEGDEYTVGNVDRQISAVCNIVGTNFIRDHLTAKSGIITLTTKQNYNKILAAKDEYYSLSDEEKELISDVLSENAGVEISYDALLEAAENMRVPYGKYIIVTVLCILVVAAVLFLTKLFLPRINDFISSAKDESKKSKHSRHRRSHSHHTPYVEAQKPSEYFTDGKIDFEKIRNSKN